MPDEPLKDDEIRGATVEPFGVVKGRQEHLLEFGLKILRLIFFRIKARLERRQASDQLNIRAAVQGATRHLLFYLQKEAELSAVIRYGASFMITKTNHALMKPVSYLETELRYVDGAHCLTVLPSLPIGREQRQDPALNLQSERM